VRTARPAPARSRRYDSFRCFGGIGSFEAEGRTLFTDEAAICTPAVLRDLDGDGIPELIAVREDPSGGDCFSPCQDKEAVREGLGVEPAWVEVYRWRDGEWNPAAREFPGFYRNLANDYGRVISWLAGRGGAVDEWRREPPSPDDCHASAWLRAQPRVFHE
jgi:hypothetical protein